MADTPVTPTPVGSWPTAPQRTDEPATFVTRADAWVAATPTRTTEMNALATNVNFNAESAFDSATEAATSASNASASEDAALASSVVALGAANFVGLYSSLTGAKTAGITAEYQGAIWLLITNSSDITADVPGVSSKWARAYGGGIIYPRTTAIEFTAEDSGKIFKITSGTFSQAFDACATLKEGWFCYVYNTGTGVITLDPDGAELIDGAATKVLPKDAMTLVICTGTALQTITTLMPLSDSHVTVTTGNGYGSTNTKIRRFTTTLSTAGTALTYADSAANGGSVTVNEAGLYEITATDGGAGSNTRYGVGASINSNQLTTNVESITASHRVFYSTPYNQSSGTGAVSGCARTMRCAVGDVIRMHNGGDTLPDSTTAAFTMLSVRKVGAL